jgi:hypothetical protein
MHQFKKHFTLDEARALLPTLREIFASIQKHKAALEKAEEASSKELERTGGDVGGKSVRQLVQSMTGLQESVTQIVQKGIQVKDLDRGLVDFPSIRDGREVFLCWELEEDDIEFWHDIEAGYAGRERL